MEIQGEITLEDTGNPTRQSLGAVFFDNPTGPTAMGGLMIQERQILDEEGNNGWKNEE